MKHLLNLVLFLLLGFSVQAQSTFLKIKATVPKQLKQGQSYKLKTTVAHNFTTEKTGGITCSFLNAKTHQSVDGWFINIFPFQYFTTIANTPLKLNFLLQSRMNSKVNLKFYWSLKQIKLKTVFTL
jgi:hypothetical protein